MKKILIVISLLLLCSCSKREDYYVFSFDDISITPGYDTVEFMHLVFDVKADGTIKGKQHMEDVKVFFWDKYFGSIDIGNTRRKEADVDEAIVTRLELYLDNINYSVLKIGDVVLKESVKENCEMFGGEYIERNGYACAFGKKVKDRENVVILYGDILGADQDALSHLEIYVK